MKRDAQQLLAELQHVLGLSIRTGQVVLNVRDGRLETFETRTFGRLKAGAISKEIEIAAQVAHTT